MANHRGVIYLRNQTKERCAPRILNLPVVEDVSEFTNNRFFNNFPIFW